jgi:hypothetical protein
MRVRVSQLASWVVCPHRCKLECRGEIVPAKALNKARTTGIKMHFELSLPYRSYDRVKVLYDIGFPKVYERPFEEHQIVGSIDDIRVLEIYSNGVFQTKVISLIEYKTTGNYPFRSKRQRVYFGIARAQAVFQLQIYCWLLAPVFDNYKYKLHTRHYVEWYDQKTKRLFCRDKVEVLSGIESIYSKIFKEWNGESPQRINENNCSVCPDNIKKLCRIRNPFPIFNGVI